MTDVRTRPTTYALIKGGNDLLYELLMLSNSVALLDEGWPGSDGLWQGKTLYMAVVESSLVHVRNLMAFFSPGRNRKDTDTIAVDYCTGEWHPARWATFEKDWAAITTDIMHMSYLRAEPARSWPYKELHEGIKAFVEQFLVDADLLNPHFRLQLRAILDGARIATALTPAVEAGAPTASEISGMIRLGSVPTSTTLTFPS